MISERILSFLYSLFFLTKFYGKECQALDETKQYTWSTVDGKPETNATAGCVSMVLILTGQKARTNSVLTSEQ